MTSGSFGWSSPSVFCIFVAPVRVFTCQKHDLPHVPLPAEGLRRRKRMNPRVRTRSSCGKTRKAGGAGCESSRRPPRDSRLLPVFGFELPGSWRGLPPDSRQPIACSHLCCAHHLIRALILPQTALDSRRDSVRPVNPPRVGRRPPSPRIEILGWLPLSLRDGSAVTNEPEMESAEGWGKCPGGASARSPGLQPWVGRGRTPRWRPSRSANLMST